MSRILFAWEMGGNFGHIARDLPLALACREAGHEVLFAVTDLSVCKSVAEEYGFAFVQAPLCRPRQSVQGVLPPINYADLLLQNGFSDLNALGATLIGWNGVFDLFKPDVMVYDFAPRALLAARLRELPVLLLGNGFETPPNVTPLPSFRHWEHTATTEHLRVEAVLVENINLVLVAHGRKRIDRIWDLFSDSPLLIAYFPEFDHFGPRPEATYVGPASRIRANQQVRWHGSGRQVLAYLRAGLPKIENLLDALRRVDAEVLCVVPDMPVAWRDRFSGLRFYKEPVNLQELLPHTQLVVTHGSGTFADSVMAGVPVLMVPGNMEQYLAARALERYGAGLILRKRDDVSSCAALAAQLISEPQYREAAKQLAQRYVGHGPEDSVRHQLAALHMVLRKC